MTEKINSNDIPGTEVAAYILSIFSDPNSGILVKVAEAEKMAIAKQWLFNQTQIVDDPTQDDVD